MSQGQIRYLLLVTRATKDRTPILQLRVKGTDSDPVPHKPTHHQFLAAMESLLAMKMVQKQFELA